MRARGTWPWWLSPRTGIVMRASETYSQAVALWREAHALIAGMVFGC